MAKLSANGQELARIEKFPERGGRFQVSIRSKRLKNGTFKLIGLLKHDIPFRSCDGTVTRIAGRWTHLSWSNQLRGTGPAMLEKAGTLLEHFESKGWTPVGLPLV